MRDDVFNIDELSESLRYVSLPWQLFDVTMTEAELRLTEDVNLREWARVEAMPFVANAGNFPPLHVGRWPEAGPVVRLAPRDWVTSYFGSHGVMGLYSLHSDEYDHIIIAEDNCDMHNIMHQSVLVHEVTHWAQKHSWGSTRYRHTPTEAKEFGAYRVQMAYLAFKGVNIRSLMVNGLPFFSPKFLQTATGSTALAAGDYAWLRPFEAIGARLAGGSSNP